MYFYITYLFSIFCCASPAAKSSRVIRDASFTKTCRVLSQGVAEKEVPVWVCNLTCIYVCIGSCACVRARAFPRFHISTRVLDGD